MAMTATKTRTDIGVVSDPIADMLTRIRNANSARHSEVRVPSSRLKLELTRVLHAQCSLLSFPLQPLARDAFDPRMIRLQRNVD